MGSARFAASTARGVHHSCGVPVTQRTQLKSTTQRQRKAIDKKQNKEKRVENDSAGESVVKKELLQGPLWLLPLMPTRKKCCETATLRISCSDGSAALLSSPHLSQVGPIRCGSANEVLSEMEVVRSTTPITTAARLITT